MNTLVRLFAIQGQLFRSSQPKIDPAILRKRDQIIAESMVPKEREPKKL